METAVEGSTLSKILPPKENEKDFEAFSVRLPKSLVRGLEAVSEESGHSRNQVVIHFLKWAMTEYANEREAEKKHRK